LTGPALQDQLPHNNCYGCGPRNDKGLRIKSYWRGSGPSVATFKPEAHHCSGPRHFVNGGILATLIDCHCVCTAIAAAYLAEGRPIGSEPEIHFATTALELKYLRPTPMESELHLAAMPEAQTPDRYVVSCELSAAGKVRVSATVEAVRVPASWMQGARHDER
jgi:acyl-coenzyme A thioesterase PaaI-like protein